MNTALIKINRAGATPRRSFSSTSAVHQGMLWLLFLFGLALLSGCNSSEERPETQSVMDRIHNSTKRPDHGLNSEQFLKEIKRVAVQGNFARLFYVETRTGQITQFPCTQCHDQHLAQIRAKTEEPIKGNHKTIVLRHAAIETMKCQTCHSDATRMKQLKLLSGTAVPFDHSYKVCAQCHFQQARDWAGGAHGKRLGGWAEPRVVRNCTGCHNPHRPGLVTRWPAIVPSAPKK